jgi:asparagine synthase (glutamine-hydrolysing)
MDKVRGRIVCGLVGFVDGSGRLKEPEIALEEMTRRLVHRGPDGQGTWFDSEAGLGLGHRRLAILDLSPQGHQPMVSGSGRYVIAYNGEVYNFRELRAELERQGQVFRGHSDTEVILAAIECWGLEPGLSRFIGMFAFALWDRAQRILYLVRDRLGIKPLYYGECNGAFIFASELKALRAYPGFAQPIDRGTLALFLRHNYVPGPYSIYQGIHKLMPGQILSLGVAQGAGFNYRTHSYWSMTEVAERGVADTFTGSPAEAVEELDGLLREAVGLRMLADVPVGAFLSGGIDSSTVVALMQQLSNRPVRTFSIGFQSEDYNEANNAREVAKHLGSEHTELYVTPEEAMQVIPRLPMLYDEPFSDNSQIPTFLVSQLARKHVTVSLSGDGGDELFGGYNRYFWGRSTWQLASRIPRVLRSLISRGLISLTPKTWERVFTRAGPLLPERLRERLPGDKLHKLASVFALDSPDAMYYGLVSVWKEPQSVVVGGQEPKTIITDLDAWADSPDFTKRMMFLDQVSYLPDDILVKLDRATMGISLEGRVPLLDHRIAEFAWRLPLSLNLRNGYGKWVLRQVLYKYVPQEMVDRPKMGFDLPVDEWLRGPLRDWAEALLDETRLRQEGFFNPRPVRESWQEHLSGNRNLHYRLWNALMFQTWLEAENAYSVDRQ